MNTTEDQMGFDFYDPIQLEVSEKVKKAKQKKKKPSNKYGLPEDYNSKEDFLNLRLISAVIKRRLPVVLIMTAIFGIFLCVVGYISSLDESKTTMMLNYEQSVEGLAPNGTRFNLSELKSEKVISQIIENAGLDSSVSTDELRDSITINAITTKKPTSKSSFYIPTSYIITYKKSKNVKGIKADNMLDVICNTYFQYFYDNYTMNAQILSDDYSVLNNMEYSQIGAYLGMRIQAISDFLTMRTNEAGSFKSEETGETFYSISKMVDNLRKYDLEKYDAFIWEKGIVDDRSVYINTREYLIDKDGRDEKYNMNEYKIRKEVIEYYNDIMSTSVLIPTVNNVKNYYMARTRTGVDYLAVNAKFYLSTAKALKKEILTNKDKISKCEPETVESNHNKADSMAENMIKEITKIEKLANQVNKEYKAEYVKSYLTFTKKSYGLLARIPKKKVILFSLIFMLLAFYVYYKECIYIAKKGKEE